MLCCAVASACWKRGKSSWVLIGSGLDQEQRTLLRRFAALTGAKLCCTWDSSVTHIICGLDAEGCAKYVLTDAWTYVNPWISLQLAECLLWPLSMFRVFKHVTEVWLSISAAAQAHHKVHARRTQRSLDCQHFMDVCLHGPGRCHAGGSA